MRESEGACDSEWEEKRGAVRLRRVGRGEVRRLVKIFVETSREVCA